MNSWIQLYLKLFDSLNFQVNEPNFKDLKAKRESVISNQIGRSGTSIGANIREAQYAHGKADFIAKLQIALKEANETGYWLELLYRTSYLTEEQFKKRLIPHTCQWYNFIY